MQKTAYEMRISDWSSDVCSSELPTIRWSRRTTPSSVPNSPRRSASAARPPGTPAVVARPPDAGRAASRPPVGPLLREHELQLSQRRPAKHRLAARRRADDGHLGSRGRVDRADLHVTPDGDELAEDAVGVCALHALSLPSLDLQVRRRKTGRAHG